MEPEGKSGMEPEADPNDEIRSDTEIEDSDQVEQLHGRVTL